MRRFFALLLVLLMSTAIAEAPLTLQNADTVEEVRQLVTLPSADEMPGVARGLVRFVSLNVQDAAFRRDMWADDTYDLTQRGSYRIDYRNMHARSAYCMALSYLGIDVTPVQMSQLTGSRDVSLPFDDVTTAISGVERVELRAYLFDTMVESFLTDDSYSPVVVEIRKPDGSKHTVLIVGYIPSTGGFIICDPAAPRKNGETLHVYNMCWHVRREAVLFSDFYDAFYESKVLGVYQWRLTDAP